MNNDQLSTKILEAEKLNLNLDQTGLYVNEQNSQISTSGYPNESRLPGPGLPLIYVPSTKIIEKNDIGPIEGDHDNIYKRIVLYLNEHKITYYYCNDKLLLTYNEGTSYELQLLKYKDSYIVRFTTSTRDTRNIEGYFSMGDLKNFLSNM